MYMYRKKTEKTLMQSQFIVFVGYDIHNKVYKCFELVMK
jgi:hypothetical protein